MNTEQRGSEKLKASCSRMSTLSPEELEQIAGAGLLSSPMGVSHYKAFPRGIPWPEVFSQRAVEGLDQKVIGPGAADLISNGI